MDTTCWVCGKTLSFPVRLLGMHVRCLRGYRQAEKRFASELQRIVECYVCHSITTDAFKEEKTRASRAS